MAAEIQIKSLEELGPVPWQCWNAPGFKDCNAEAGNITYRKLTRDMGMSPSAPEWAMAYKILLRNQVAQCEILSNCRQDLVETQRREQQGGETDSDIASRLREQMAAEDAKKASMGKWLVGALALGVGFFVYKRMKS